MQITTSWRLNQQPLHCPRRLEVKVTVPADMVRAEDPHLGSQRAAPLQCPALEPAAEKGGDFRCLFMRGTDSIPEAPPSWPNDLPASHLQIPSQ